MLHSGLDEQAATLARRMIATFEAADVDTIVINAAGCGSTMKEYGHLLRDDPAWAARAAVFSAKCKDISEILCELPPRATARRPCGWPTTTLAICATRKASMLSRGPAGRNPGP